MKANILKILTLISAAMVFCACPNQISTDLLEQMNDSDGPLVTIVEPVDKSDYSTMVAVSGSVTDGSSDTAFSAENIYSCSYSIEGTTVEGNFDLDDEGNFSFLFATREADGTALIAGPVTLELFAVDWNGNTGSSSIQLLQPDEGDISGFTVTPANKSVTIEWDDVAGAESYDLFRYEYGITIENVTSPYTWSDLDNGVSYSFQLTAHMPDGAGDDALSSITSAMPLSPRTLALRIRETGYGTISLEWQDNPYVDNYILERSLSSDGPWQTYQRTMENCYIDTGLDFDMTYYYRVYNGDCPDIKSQSVGAVPARFANSIESVVATSGEAQNVFVSGGYAYVADGESGLAIIDVSNPAEPGTPVYVDTNGEALNVCISGGYAYVADNDSGLAIIDVSDPAHPGEPVYKDTSGYAQSVAVDGGYAYVADLGSGLAVINVENPASPGALSYVTPGSWTTRDIVVSGDVAYVAGTLGLTSLDISDRAAPAILDSEQTNVDGKTYGVDLAGDYAFIANSGAGITVMNISDPGNLSYITSRDTGFSAVDLTVSGGYVYAANSQAGMAKLNVYDPEFPGAPGYVYTKGNARGIDVDGSYIYAACEEGGLAIINSSHPADSGSVEYDDVAGEARYLSVSGDLACVANTSKELVFLDIGTPASPVKLSSASMGATVLAVHIAGDYAYAALGSEGIAVIDISDPAAPGTPVIVDLENFVDPSIAYDVETSGDYAYVTDAVNGLAIIDISDPGSPGAPDYVPISSNAYGLKIYGNHVYVACNESGLAIIDITDPENPGSPVYRETAGDKAKVVDVAGNYAYVGVYSKGLAIIDISDPDNPGAPVYRTAKVNGENKVNPRGIVVSGGCAYLTDSTNNYLSIIDITDPEEASSDSAVNTSILLTDAFGAVVFGSTVYVGANSGGLAIFDLIEGD